MTNVWQAGRHLARTETCTDKFKRFPSAGLLGFWLTSGKSKEIGTSWELLSSARKEMLKCFKHYCCSTCDIGGSCRSSNNFSVTCWKLAAWKHTISFTIRQPSLPSLRIHTCNNEKLFMVTFSLLQQLKYTFSTRRSVGKATVAALFSQSELKWTFV